MSNFLRILSTVTLGLALQGSVSPAQAGDIQDSDKEVSDRKDLRKQLRMDRQEMRADRREMMQMLREDRRERSEERHREHAERRNQFR